MDPPSKRQKPSDEELDLQDWINVSKKKYSLYYKTLYDKDIIFSRDDSLHSIVQNYDYYTNLLADITLLLQKVTRFYENSVEFKKQAYPGVGLQFASFLDGIESKDLNTKFDIFRFVNQQLELEIQDSLNPPPMSPISPKKCVPVGTCVPGTPPETLPPYPPAANIEAYFLPYDEKKEEMEMLMAKYELRLKRYAKLFKRDPVVASFVSKELDNLLETQFNKLNETLKATTEMTIEKLRNSDERIAQFVLEKLKDPNSMRMIR
jgi:hypothetical protein